jgi:hypothetical protein
MVFLYMAPIESTTQTARGGTQAACVIVAERHRIEQV